MRVQTLLMLGLLGAACAGAQELTPVREASAALAAQSSAAIYNGPRPKISMWIWSDKYVYQAGQNLTLRWTVKTNGDLYPYTVFVYRQNNQTGKKTYFPGGSESPTDLNGNTAAQGFQPVQLADAAKAVLIGSGGKFPALSMPNELGMHTVVVELRDYTGTRVLKSSYMKVGVVKGATTITSDITADPTLTNGTEKALKATIYVKHSATTT